MYVKMQNRSICRSQAKHDRISTLSVYFMVKIIHFSISWQHFCNIFRSFLSLRLFVCSLEVFWIVCIRLFFSGCL